MIYQLNNHSILGRVGNEPEIKQTSSGKTLATFSVATSSKWLDKATGEEKENTTWHNVVVWRESTTKFVQNFVKKGALVFVQGAIQNQEYTDEEGNKKTSTKLVVSNAQSQVILPDPGSPHLSVGRIMNINPGGTRPQGKSVNEDEDDPIPF